MHAENFDVKLPKGDRRFQNCCWLLSQRKYKTKDNSLVCLQQFPFCCARSSSCTNKISSLIIMFWPKPPRQCPCKQMRFLGKFGSVVSLCSKFFFPFKSENSEDHLINVSHLHIHGVSKCGPGQELGPHILRCQSYWKPSCQGQKISQGRCTVRSIEKRAQVIFSSWILAGKWKKYKFRIELEFGNVGFWGEGKTGVPGEKPLGAEKRTNNNLNPHMTPGPGLEPETHWCPQCICNQCMCI